MALDEKDIQDLIGAVPESVGVEKEGVAAEVTEQIIEPITEEDGESEVSAESEESEVDELTELKAQIAELKAQQTQAEEPMDKPIAEIAPVVEDLQDIDFFSQHSMRDVMDDEDVFKSWFAESIDKVRKADRDSIMQMVYKNLPAIIQKHVVEQVENKSGADKFYADNPDLTTHKKRVAVMANSVKEMFPDLSGEEFLVKVADLTRQAVGLEKQVKENPGEKPGKKAKPALVDKSVKAVAKRSAVEEVGGMEKEIQDLLNVI